MTGGGFGDGAKRERVTAARKATEKVISERLEKIAEERGVDIDRPSGAEHAQSVLGRWLGGRIALSKIEDDFSDEEYADLIQVANEASRLNWGATSSDPSTRAAADALQAAFFQKGGGQSATLAPRGTFDALVPDVGELQRQGLLKDAQHYLKAKYKASTDGNVQTVRRHWFRYCLTSARISPIRPQTGTSLDAALVEEATWIGFAAYLARRVSGATVAGYISLLKRWHKGVVGWDPITSAVVDKLMLKQALAGIRAELPSKKRQRYAHPTRLFKQWWAPLERRSGSGPAVLDLDCPDLSKLSWQTRIEIAVTLRRQIIETGMSLQDLKYLTLSSAMTAGLLRVSEAIPKRGSEQPPPMRGDCAMKFDSSGLLTHVNLWILPLKKGKGVQKLPVKIKCSRGNIRAAFFLWLLDAIDPVKPESAASTPLFRDFSWEGGEILGQDDFRRWYQEQLKAADVTLYKNYNTHSFRISGATALLAAKVPIELIKAMGRWASDVAEVYTRPTEESLLQLSEAMDAVEATGLEDADDEYFDRVAGVTEDDADAWAEAIAADTIVEELPGGTAGVD